ncbi:MAG: hypothetical protein H7123_07330, partial [Thermoleophilia bacterium]|nr:hypothetical protein [Thermoleophilia bacterium]
VTAADSMPNDAQLIELEDRVMGREASNDDVADDAGSRTASASQVAAATAAVAAANAPRAIQPRPNRIDMVDDWDPAADDELAEEYGTVLRDLAEARRDVREAAPEGGESRHDHVGGSVRAIADAAFEQAQLVERSATVAPLNSMANAAYGRQDITNERRQSDRHESAGYRVGRNVAVNNDEDYSASDVSARKLALRAHEAIAAATEEIERQVSTSRFTQANGTGGVGGGGGGVTLRADVMNSQPTKRPGILRAPQRLASPHEQNLHEPRSTFVEGTPEVVSHGTVMPVSAITGATDGRLLDAAAQMQTYLHSTGVDNDVAEALLHNIVAHRIPFVAERDLRDLVRETIAETINVSTGWPAIGHCHRIAIVGASGSGKSSVVAKLAEGYAASGLSVGVVSIIAGANTSSQIAAHANDPLIRRGTMEVQFAADVDQMIAALQRFDGRDVVLIDTPSSTYLDAASFNAVSRCLAAVRIDDVQVTIPLATSVREAESVVQHFQPMGVQRLIVTKLDESRYAGQLLNYGFRFGLPMTFLTDGQRVPDDIRAASATEIAELIVPRQHEGDIAQ